MTTVTLERPRALRTAEVAHICGVTPQAVRLAEREQRIPPAEREVGGDDRAYTPEQLAVIREYFSRTTR